MPHFSTAHELAGFQEFADLVHESLSLGRRLTFASPILLRVIQLAILEVSDLEVTSHTVIYCM